MREVKARISELKKDPSISPVAYLINAEKQSMMSNELEEFEAQFGDYSGSQDSSELA